MSIEYKCDVAIGSMNHSMSHTCVRKRTSVSAFSNFESTLSINISMSIHEWQESKKISISLYLGKSACFRGKK